MDGIYIRHKCSCHENYSFNFRSIQKKQLVNEFSLCTENAWRINGSYMQISRWIWFLKRNSNKCWIQLTRFSFKSKMESRWWYYKWWRIYVFSRKYKYLSIQDSRILRKPTKDRWSYSWICESKICKLRKNSFQISNSFRMYDAGLS